MLISLSGAKLLNKDGKSTNVTKKDTIKPSVIIQPKSIIGFILLKIKDRNAQIVVNAVYNIGRTIFSHVINTAFPF